jgi:hypothetical protein
MAPVGPIGELERNPHPATSPTEEESAVDKAAKRTATATVWIAVFTVVLALVGIFTLIEVVLGGSDTHELAVQAKNQADRMKDLADRMKDQADRTKTIADQAIIQAGAAKSAAETASTSLKQSRKVFSTEQRPYLVSDVPGFVQTSIVAGQGITASVTVRNIGKTPARKVLTNLRMEPFHPSDTTAFIKFVDGLFAALTEKDRIGRRKIVTTPGAEQDIAPGANQFGTSDPVVLGSDDTKTILLEQGLDVGRVTLFYVGLVSYTDAFDVPYQTEFCYFYFGSKLTTWHICDLHNTLK